MKIVCFPHCCYLSEVSRLVEIGTALRRLGQDVVFLSHGGTHEQVVEQAGFEVVAGPPAMSANRTEEYMAFNRREYGNLFRDSLFSLAEQRVEADCELDRSTQHRR